jgi:hypothetical protein
MTFLENRYPLFRITLWKRSILQRFARQRKPLSAGEASPLRARADHSVNDFATAQQKKPRTMPGL